MRGLTCSQTGQVLGLTQEIARSGEGEIWRTDQPGLLAKIYHHPTPDRIRKLEVMIANPPQDPNASINHISFAWPQSLLCDQSGCGVGFLMPEITNSVQLLDVYHPRQRQKILPGFNWLYLHVTAMNIASIMQAIHARGYVLGDVKPQNILVDNQALPAVIDTDSFQVRHPQTGEVYRCPVGSEGFTPPELLAQDLATVEQTEVHDRFRLAVVIHLLLFGDQPFKGKWTGWGESPDPNELLRLGYWPYAPNSLIQPGPLTIPLATAHPEIQQCFLRCFNDGYTNPALRPTAAEWVQALKAAVAELKACRRVNGHYYSQTYGKCYWCDRKRELGIDIFPVVALSPEQWRARNRQIVEQVLSQTRSRLEAIVPKPLAIAPKTLPLTPQKLTQLLETAKGKLARPDLLPRPTLPSAWKAKLATPKPIPRLQLPQFRPGTSAPTKPSPWLSLPGAWKKYAIATGVVASVFIAPILLGRFLMSQKDAESIFVGFFLFLAIVALWSWMNQSTDQSNL